MLKYIILIIDPLVHPCAVNVYTVKVYRSWLKSTYPNLINNVTEKNIGLVTVFESKLKLIRFIIYFSTQKALISLYLTSIVRAVKSVFISRLTCHKLATMTSWSAKFAYFYVNNSA